DDGALARRSVPVGAGAACTAAGSGRGASLPDVPVHALALDAAAAPAAPPSVRQATAPLPLAGGENQQPRAGSEHPANVRGRCQQVLAVVEDNEPVLAAARRGQLADQPRVTSWLDVHRLGPLYHHPSRVP